MIGLVIVDERLESPIFHCVGLRVAVSGDRTLRANIFRAQYGS